MFLLHITTVRADGSQDTVELSMASQLEFEQIETMSIIDALDNKVSQRILTRLSWLATKQTGGIVPASLDEYAKTIKTCGYRIETIPFGEPASTSSTQTSSSPASATQT